jgi:hypothetical protein
MPNSIDKTSPSKKEDLENLKVEDELKIISYLRDNLNDTYKKELEGRIKNNPKGWVYEGSPQPFHFNEGMHLRNLIRNGGFNEEYLGIENLDNIYAYLIKRALDV